MASMEVRVLWDAARSRIVYVEAGAAFVDRLAALLLVPVGALAEFASESVKGASPLVPLDECAPAASPLVTLKDSLAKVNTCVFDQETSVLTKVLKQTADFHTIHTHGSEKFDGTLNSIVRVQTEVSSWNNRNLNVLPPVRIDKRVAIGRIMQQSSLFCVTNDLFVTRSSMICSFEHLRAYEPDATKWVGFVGVTISVSTDHVREIARSALACRPRVLDDALGSAVRSVLPAEVPEAGETPLPTSPTSSAGDSDGSYVKMHDSHTH